MLTSSKFADIIPRSWHCRHPSMDGLPVASTMLNLILADLSLKETLKVVANEDTMLRTHCCGHTFPCLPMRATFVADTNFVSETQKMFLIFVRNILCLQQMFPRLCGMDTKQMFCVPLVCPPKKHHEQQCVRNIVSSFATTFKVATPRFSISEPPYPLRTLLHGRIVIANGKCCRSVEVMTQASAPVSTFRLMSWTLLILTLAKILSGWLSRALSEI